MTRTIRTLIAALALAVAATLLTAFPAATTAQARPIGAVKLLRFCTGVSHPATVAKWAKD